jgi:hypothetical protein
MFLAMVAASAHASWPGFLDEASSSGPHTSSGRPAAALAGPGEVLALATTHDMLDGSGLSIESR